MRRIEAGGSVLDLILDKARRLERSSDPADRARLDQYFQSVRELEGRLQRSIDWENRPKPKVDYPMPRDIADANEVVARSRLMFGLIRLALQTDSTRVVTLSLSTFSVVPHVPGVKNETHGLTHHGNEPEKIAELRRIEEAQLKVFGELLGSLRGTPETGGNLLDRTQALPMILAGGGFRHGGHLRFDPVNNTPLANLYVSMLRKMEVDADRFASSNGPLRGLA